MRASKNELFPHSDGPNCKYAALFDLRPMFDGLRFAFLLSADPLSRMSRFKETIFDIIGSETPPSPQVIENALRFTEEIQYFEQGVGLLQVLPNFARRAWPV